MLRRIVLNSGAMLTGQVIVKTLGLVWLAIIARHLGDEDFGRLTYSFSLASLVGIIVEFGFSPVIVRAVSRNPKEAGRYLSNTLSLRLGLSIFTVPATIAISLFTGATTSTLGPVWIAAIATSAAGIYAISNSIFFARERMEFPAIIMVVSKLLAITVGLWVVSRGAGIVWVALVFLLEALLNLVLSVIIVRRQFALPYVPRLELPFCRKLLRAALPFALAQALGLVYFKIDVVMLSAMKGSQVVGWYSAGYRLLEGLIYLPAAFITAIYPTLSRLKTPSPEKLRTTVERSWEFIIAFALPLALGLALTGDRIVPAFFGEQFLPAIPVLHWIGASLFFVFINNYLGVLLGAIDRQGVHFYASLAGVILNVSLNLYLIPRYAHIGAARATLITQLLLTILLSILVVRMIRVRLSAVRLLKIFFAAALMAAVLVFWQNLPLAGEILLGAGVYLAALLVTRTLTPMERRQIRELVLPSK